MEPVGSSKQASWKFLSFHGDLRSSHRPLDGLLADFAYQKSIPEDLMPPPHLACSGWLGQVVSQSELLPGVKGVGILNLMAEFPLFPG